MIKKRAFVIIACIVVFYALTLGIHFSRYVRAYCKSDSPNVQPEVYVIMHPIYDTTGIPVICSTSYDVLPYPLEILVKVDDRVEGDGAVIELLEATFADGTMISAIYTGDPRGGPFAEHTPVPSDRVAGRSFRQARIGIPGAIWQRGSFTINIRGYLYGRQKVPFDRKLRMEYNREFNIYTGWKLLAGASC